MIKDFGLQKFDEILCDKLWQPKEPKFCFQKNKVKNDLPDLIYRYVKLNIYLLWEKWESCRQTKFQR